MLRESIRMQGRVVIRGLVFMESAITKQIRNGEEIMTEVVKPKGKRLTRLVEYPLYDMRLKGRVVMCDPSPQRLDTMCDEHQSNRLLEPRL